MLLSIAFVGYNLQVNGGVVVDLQLAIQALVVDDEAIFGEANILRWKHNT